VDGKQEMMWKEHVSWFEVGLLLKALTKITVSQGCNMALLGRILTLNRIDKNMLDYTV